MLPIEQGLRRVFEARERVEEVAVLEPIPGRDNGKRRRKVGVRTGELRQGRPGVPEARRDSLEMRVEVPSYAFEK